MIVQSTAVDTKCIDSVTHKHPQTSLCMVSSKTTLCRSTPTAYLCKKSQPKHSGILGRGVTIAKTVSKQRCKTTTTLRLLLHKLNCEV